MKRLHIHLSVNNLADSINFYNTLFGAEPTTTKPDYAKWNLDEPAVHFAISNRGKSEGLNHLGIQVETEMELDAIAKRLADAEIKASEQKGVSCCYSKSNKYWSLDPQGIAWESFQSMEALTLFSGESTADSSNSFGNSFGNSSGNDSGNNSANHSSCCVPLMADEDNHHDCCVPNESSECCA